MIVVIDCHMTSSAKYADILLPDCTASEQMDFALDASCGNMSYVIFTDQVIQPRFERKTIYDLKRAGETSGRSPAVHRRAVSGGMAAVSVRPYASGGAGFTDLRCPP
ncbi:molybdopterin-dependent oxidoreductase [Escherichia coli]